MLQNSHSSSKKTTSPRKRQQQQIPLQQAQVKRPKIFLIEEENEKLKKKPILLWVDKYKPKTIKQLIGQQTDKSQTNKLLDWLRNWAKYNLTHSGEKKKGFF